METKNKIPLYVINITKPIPLETAKQSHLLEETKRQVGRDIANKIFEHIKFSTEQKNGKVNVTGELIISETKGIEIIKETFKAKDLVTLIGNE